MSLLILLAAMTLAVRGIAYPPAVGILGSARDCSSCHSQSGPWKDDSTVLIDIIDKELNRSLKQANGNFIITVKRHEKKTVLTVIGTRNKTIAPKRNAWIYIDNSKEASTSLSKFPLGWMIDIQMSCRVVGDKYLTDSNAAVTVVPTTLLAGDSAKAATITLHAMLTEGSAVKGKPNEGLTSNSFQRTVVLAIED